MQFWTSLVFVYILGAIAESSAKHRDRRVPFKTYWNIPTFVCARHGLDFEALAEKYHIIQNKNDSFRGDQISLLYNPGLFPAILPDGSLKNGGVPQAGDLAKHLRKFAADIDELIPDVEFSGLGIIDFEDWRPVYRQNFGTLSMYKDLSEKIEKQKHPHYSPSQIKQEASVRFEKAARSFMGDALSTAQRLRPKAVWGYYGLPYCFNNDMQDRCPTNVENENNRIKWLFTASDTLNPSLYLREATYTTHQRVQFIKGRVQEAQRIVKNVKKQKHHTVIPYYTLIYPDTDNYLSEEDIKKSIETLQALHVDGLVVWGSSSHLNTQQKCEAMYKYVDTIFGPALNRSFN